MKYRWIFNYVCIEIKSDLIYVYIIVLDALNDLVGFAFCVICLKAYLKHSIS